MALSFVETGARFIVTRFLRDFITAGSLTLLEDGGNVFTFQGNTKKCPYKSVIKIHSPQFYWKIMTQADIGLADAYINGDFSFDDKDQGLLNLLLVIIASRDSNPKMVNNRSGWWSPTLLTAGLASGIYFFRHMSRKNNTVTRARRNIARHYDLSNDFFAMFMDGTMAYSCAIFENEDEDLKTAQLRKFSILIDKARIEKRHEVLEIGSGWGQLGIEIVKRTGCKYTGITLSKEQLKFCQQSAKEAGLDEDNIRFILCSYRQLPADHKYDRIISCEMIEHVGHEYIGDFFSSCESVLSENGLFVIQFISIPDYRYEAYRRSSDFVKEYIFPGVSIPCLSRVLSAMADSSRFCVEHIDNIGINYYKTLRCWRKSLFAKKSEVFAMGFDEKFLRTWEYYFDYGAAGYKSRTLQDYHIVFSRPGNVSVLGDPFPSPI